MKKLLITGAAVFATAFLSLVSAQDLQAMQKQRETLKYRLDLMDKQIELEKAFRSVTSVKLQHKIWIKKRTTKVEISLKKAILQKLKKMQKPLLKQWRKPKAPTKIWSAVRIKLSILKATSESWNRSWIIPNTSLRLKKNKVESRLSGIF